MAEDFYSRRYGPKPDIVKNVPEAPSRNYVSLTLDPESDLDLSGSGNGKPLLSGTIHPFHKSHTTSIGHICEEIQILLTRQRVKLVTFSIIFNILVVLCLSSWYSSTQSLTLYVCNYICMSELLLLFTNIVSEWTVVQENKKSHLSDVYTLGYKRMEVLAVFSSMIVAHLGAIFIIKETLERMVNQPEIHAGRLLPGAVLGFSFIVAVNYFVESYAFMSICRVSSSSWMQKNVAEVTQNICGILPGLRTILPPHINPILIVSFLSGCAVLFVDALLQINSYYFIDTLLGLVITIIVILTLSPMLVSSGWILLQTTPSHILGQLDKLLSEVQTLDGVLEILAQRFYTLSIEKSKPKDEGSKSNFKLAGSVHVRIRRDANEQLVLAHVINRLSSLASLVFVQIVKDDWITSPGIGSRSVTVKIQESNPRKNERFATPTSLYYGQKKDAVASHYTDGVSAKINPNIDTSTEILMCKPGDNSASRPTDDFSFSSSNRIPLIKPQSSQTNIQRMYKAGRLHSLSQNKLSLLYNSSTLLNTESSRKTSSNFPISK